MLNDNLYTITSFTNENGKIEASIKIDATHKIFEGHFPGQPVVPGVCMVQLIKELTEKATGKKLFLNEASQCKFLSMVNPQKTAELIALITHTSAGENTLTITAQLKNETAVFFKMNAKMNMETD